MNYYSLKLKLWDDNIRDELSEGPKVYPRANGTNISNNNGYLTTRDNLGKIYFENYVDETPIFDYFYLYNSTYQKVYDWILLDAYGFIGQVVPSCRGFLVSRKLKEFLEKFDIAKPFRFYESMLMYQGRKLEYYIFHLAQNEWKEFNSKLSTFELNNETLDYSVSTNKQLKQLIKTNPNVKLNISLNHVSDVFYFSQFEYIVSEELKKALEESDINCFEFKSLNNISFF